MRHVSEAMPEIVEPNPFRDLGDTEVARVVRESAWIRAFCAEVVDVYRTGAWLRHETGLTQADVAYAAAVGAWAEYRGDLAAWTLDEDNRSAVRASNSGQPLDETQQARLKSRPRQPDRPRPEALTQPQDWPADPTRPTWGEALAAFLRARRRSVVD